MEFSIHSDVEETRLRRIKQTIDHGTVEKMVAHCEKKGFADAASGGKKRDAILFSPVTVFDEGCAETGGNELFDLCDHPLAFIANHEVDRSDPAVKQGVQSVRYQGSATHRDEWLQKSFIGTA